MKISNSLIVEFYFENELRYLRIGKIYNMCISYSGKRNPKLSEDFASWAMVEVMTRIRKRISKNSHLNNISWLWSQYINEKFGVKSPLYKKALSAKIESQMLSVEKLYYIESDSLDTESYLLFKESLTKRYK